MPVILPVKGVLPNIPDDCYIAENATVVGDVVMGKECSVWFNAVVWGDVNSIRMGDRVNIQDGACIHCTYQKTKTIIGNNVSIGHHAIVHGCRVDDNVLIGMGMDRLFECLAQQVLPAFRIGNVSVGAKYDVVGGQ